MKKRLSPLHTHLATYRHRFLAHPHRFLAHPHRLLAVGRHALFAACTLGLLTACVLSRQARTPQPLTQGVYPPQQIEHTATPHGTPTSYPLAGTHFWGNHPTHYAPHTWQSSLQEQLTRLLQDPLFAHTQLGLCVYDLTDGQLLFSVNSQQRMRPASCQKLVTAITALHLLGSDYPLTTRVYTTAQPDAQGTLAADLYVQGGMDPLLSARDVSTLARTLYRQGIRCITGRLYLDLQRKDDKPLGWGWCWDDGYAPLIPLTVAGSDTFATQWVQALQAEGIYLSQPTPTPRATPARATEVAHLSHPLRDLLPRMLKQSDNAYAESLFYQLAFHTGKPQAGRAEAVQAIHSLLGQLGVPASQYLVADGSGVSLYNYLTPHLLLTLLQHAHRHPSLFQPLYQSLPVAGADGTLRRRMQGSPAAHNVRAKTGTVTGVSTLAGYCTHPSGHLLAFCILNQGLEQGQQGRTFQDRVCIALCGGRPSTP